MSARSKEQEVFHRVPTCAEVELCKDTLDSKDGQGEVTRAKTEIANKSEGSIPLHRFEPGTGEHHKGLRST